MLKIVMIAFTAYKVKRMYLHKDDETSLVIAVSDFESIGEKSFESAGLRFYIEI
jgi:hypothetical protein